MSRAHLDKEPHEIAAMFDGVAEKYDRTNTILSFGRDRAWRRATAEAVGRPTADPDKAQGARPGDTPDDLDKSVVFRKVYLSYLMGSLPAVARKVASNPDAYVYLAESIRAWPDQKALAAIVAAAGWTSVRIRNLTGGIAALHQAVRA